MSNLRAILDKIQNPTIDNEAILDDGNTYTGAGTYYGQVGGNPKVIDLHGADNVSASVNRVLVLALYIESVVQPNAETYTLLIEESDDPAFATIPDFTTLEIDPLADDDSRIAKVLMPSHRYLRYGYVLAGVAPELKTRIGFHSPYAKSS